MNSSRAQQYDTLAFVMLLLGFLLNQAFAAYSATGFFSTGPERPPVYKFGMGIAMVSILALYYCIGQGRRWAKILFLVLFVVGIPIVVLEIGDKLASAGQAPAATGVYVLHNLLQAAGTVFIGLSFRSSRAAANEEFLT